MSNIVLIHLSDLHFDDISIKDNRDPIKRQELANKCCEVLDGLADSIIKIANDLHINGLPHVYLVITGDIAFHGAESEYGKIYETFLKKLSALGYADIFFCPGNHDMDRERFDQAVFSKPIEHHGGFSVSRIDLLAMEDPDTVDYIEGIVKDPSSRKKNFIDPMFEYYNFVDKKTRGKPIDDKNKKEQLYRIYRILVDGKIVNIICLNSSFIYGGENRAYYGYLSIEQILSAFEKVESEQFNIVLLHHPFEAHFSANLQQIKAYLAEKAGLILTGHVHRFEVSEYLSANKRPVGLPVLGSARGVIDDHPEEFSVTSRLINERINEPFIPGYFIYSIEFNNFKIHRIKIYQIRYQEKADLENDITKRPKGVWVKEYPWPRIINLNMRVGVSPRVIRISEQRIRLPVEEAERCFESNRFEKALEYCNKVIDKHPECLDARFNRALALYRLEKCPQAYEEIVSLEKDSIENGRLPIDIVRLKAAIEESMSNYHDAACELKKAWETASRSDRDELEVDMTNLAFNLIDKNLNRDDAIDLLEKIRKSNPDDYQVLKSLGLAYAHLEDKCELSITLLKEASGRNPQDTDIHNTLATLYAIKKKNMHQLKKELEEVRKSRDNDPDYKPFHVTLYEGYLQMNEKTRATEVLREAISKKIFTPEYYKELQESTNAQVFLPGEKELVKIMLDEWQVISSENMRLAC